jgi:Tfp pilus assembly protein PilN
MSLSWNLLNYPALHQKRRRRHRITTSLAGLVVGALMAGASLFWMERSLQGLRLQQAHLQAQWGEARQQLKLEQQQAAARESSRQQMQHLRQVLGQHQAWSALNQALLLEAQEDSWRLVRLQLEPGKLELSGWSRDFEALNASRRRLTDHLQAAWPESLAQSTAAHVAPSEAQHVTPSSAKGRALSTTSTEQVRQTSVSVRGGPDMNSFKNAAGLDFVWVSPWPTFKSMAAPAQSMAQGATP